MESNKMTGKTRAEIIKGLAIMFFVFTVVLTVSNVILLLSWMSAEADQEEQLESLSQPSLDHIEGIDLTQFIEDVLYIEDIEEQAISNGEQEAERILLSIAFGDTDAHDPNMSDVRRLSLIILALADENEENCWHLAHLAELIDAQAKIYPETELARFRNELPLESSDLEDCSHRK